jgi:hypothetical protein
MRRAGRPLLLAAGLAVLLAGCAALGFGKKETRGCPGFAVLRDAGRTTQYREGPGRDLLDVRYAVEIGEVTGSCTFDDDQVRMTVAVDLLFTRGPAAEGRQAQVPFFVAVTKGEDRILAKQVFQSAVEFPPDRRRAGVREEVDEVIQLAPGEDPTLYEVIVGLQVSEEQLERNRRR